MIVYDVATKKLDTNSFPQHTIADLISGIIVQSGEAFTVEGNKHTHTHYSSKKLFNVIVVLPKNIKTASVTPLDK